MHRIIMSDKMFVSTLSVLSTSWMITAPLVRIESPYDQLYRTLFNDYIKQVRPVTYVGEQTIVRVSPNLYSIVTVKEDEETVALSRWLQMFWYDTRLVWDPDDYNGTKELLVDATKLWVPDITIIELLDYRNAGSLMDFASITYDGLVRYSLNDIIELYCLMDPSDFPNDIQNCSASYVSWEYPAEQLNVDPWPSEHRYLQFYGRSSEWRLINYTYDNQVVITDNASISFNATRFWVAFQRKGYFYVLALVIPSFLITTLSIFGIFSPSSATLERYERITLGLTASLAMSVVLIMVTDLMPKSDKSFPLLGQYIVWSMGITTVATVMAIGVMYLNCYGEGMEQNMPHWLLCLLCVPHDKERQQTYVHHNDLKIDEMQSNGTATMGNFGGANSDILQMHTTSGSEPFSARRTIANTLAAVQKIAVDISKELTDRKIEQRRVLLAAKVCYRIDLVLCAMFTVINCVITFSFFYRPQSKQAQGILLDD